MQKCYDLSAKDKNIQVHICFFCRFFGGGAEWEGVVLCTVEVKSEQGTLESFAEDIK